MSTLVKFNVTPEETVAIWKIAKLDEQTFTAPITGTYEVGGLPHRLEKGEAIRARSAPFELATSDGEIMSFHKNDTPELKEALALHGLEADSPSQLSDAFRTGYRYALSAKLGGAVVPLRKALSDALNIIDDENDDGTGWVAWREEVENMLAAAPQPVEVAVK